MSARAIQGQKAIATEMFVQPVLPSDAVIPAGVLGANMIAAIEIRPDDILDNAERKERLQAKGHGANEDARIAIKAKGRVIFGIRSKSSRPKLRATISPSYTNPDVTLCEKQWPTLNGN